MLEQTEISQYNSNYIWSYRFRSVLPVSKLLSDLELLNYIDVSFGRLYLVDYKDNPPNFAIHTQVKGTLKLAKSE